MTHRMFALVQMLHKRHCLTTTSGEAARFVLARQSVLCVASLVAPPFVYMETNGAAHTRHDFQLLQTCLGRLEMGAETEKFYLILPEVQSRPNLWDLNDNSYYCDRDLKI